MDEASGTTMKDETGNHPGSLHTVGLAEVGVASTGYRFNGTSSYVRIPNAPDLNAGPRDVHIAFSMNTTTVPAVPDYDLFRKGQAPGQEYKVELQPDGSVTCYFKGDLGSTTATSRPGLQDGKWHDIRCEKFASSVVLTVDGTKYTKAKAVGSISNDFDMIVGAYPTGDFYRGFMDELSFSIDGNLVAPPTASFTATPVTGAAPLDVAFEDTSTRHAHQLVLELRGQQQLHHPEPHPHVQCPGDLPRDPHGEERGRLDHGHQDRDGPGRDGAGRQLHRLHRQRGGRRLHRDAPAAVAQRRLHAYLGHHPPGELG